MKKRSEGIRRIVLLISILSVISWISYVAVASEGFSKFHHDDLFGWAVFIGGAILLFFIPLLICKICYWVRDGFKKDKETQ